MSDFDPFREHDKPDEGMNEQPDEDETIPLNPMGSQMGSSWEPE